jgi:DNA-directed RNA polymerase specialized sigma24 family protein
MEAAPHEEPSPSYADVPSNPTKPWVLLLVEAVIDGLSEEEQEIVGVLVMEKLSLRVAGKILNIPKSTLARRRDKIWKKIEKELLAYPEVWEYINGNWNPRRRTPS